MLRMNKLADYGAVVMVCLVHAKHQVLSARDISKQTHLSLATVSKVLKRLTAAKLLVSSRGAQGGYGLKHPAEEISVLDILYALDEARGLTECSFDTTTCALQAVCHVQDNWRLMSQSIEAALKRVSLAELAKPTLSLQTLNQMKEVVMMGVSRVESA